MRFNFLRDPLFLLATTLFILNRLYLQPNFPHNPIIHSYLNDILCLPVWVPFMTWLLHQLKIRDEVPPRPAEIWVSLAFWSLMFEVWLPGTHFLEKFAPGDPLDIVAYTVGGILAFAFWKAWYNAPRTLKLRA